MKKFLIGFLVLILALAAISFALPGSYEVQRSIVIAADAQRIQAPLSDLTTWPEWSAWSRERDASAEWSFSGDVGEGQEWKWEGEELGKGRLRLTKVIPGEGILYQIAFIDPDMQGTGHISIETSGESCTVTWTSRGELGRNPLNRLFGVFLDGILGPDLETGLAGIKRVAEAGPQGIGAVEAGESTGEDSPPEDSGADTDQ
ncbi:MAG: hypothetical protein ACI8QS_001229 [Planctomycetota bacterium]|jgi:hypothetical protein